MGDSDLGDNDVDLMEKNREWYFAYISAPIPDRVKNLRDRLMQRMDSHSKGKPAHRLWRASLAVLPESTVSAFDLTAKQNKSKIRSGYHLRLVTDMLNREGDAYLDPQLGGRDVFLLAQNLIKKYAAQEERTEDSVLEDWATAGSAIKDVCAIRKISLAREASGWYPKAGRCQLCWRVGTSNGRAIYHCDDHQPHTDAYKRHRELVTWQSPDLVGVSHKSFYWETWSGLQDCIARSDRWGDEFGLDKVYAGVPEAVDQLRLVMVDFRRYWPLFRLTKKLVDRRLGNRGSVELSISSVIAALDPPSRKGRAIQRAVHAALERDQRLFVAMLMDAECWLVTRQARAANWGGTRMKGAKAPEHWHVFALDR